MKRHIKVDGMSCQHCVSHVTKALEAIEGVEAVSVSLEAHEAVVVAPLSVSDEELVTAIAEAGYEPGDIAQLD